LGFKKLRNKEVGAQKQKKTTTSATLPYIFVASVQIRLCKLFALLYVSGTCMYRKKQFAKHANASCASMAN
jgi:hypothetical protein